MKKIISIFSFCILMVGFASAQPIDKATKDLLNAVKNKYTAYSTIQLKFKYTLIDKQSDFTDEKTGDIYLQKEKFKLSMDNIEILSNNKYVWMHLKELNQVSILNYTPELMKDEFGFSPTELFEFKEDDYLSKINGTIKYNNKEVYEVELTPKKKDNNVFKIKIYIDVKTNEVLKSMIFESSGTVYEIELTEQIPNKVFSTNMFTFDEKKNANVIVEDLRD